VLMEQVRRNGDLYLAHCVETAIILAAAGVGSTVVAAGLLHDALDDSNLSLQSLRAALGEDVASLIVGVSNIELIQHAQQMDLRLNMQVNLLQEQCFVVFVKLTT
jgi:(p)ppGpp synthase/HD superfamily hydrolase